MLQAIPDYRAGTYHYAQAANLLDGVETVATDFVFGKALGAIGVGGKVVYAGLASGAKLIAPALGEAIFKYAECTGFIFYAVENTGVSTFKSGNLSQAIDASRSIKKYTGDELDGNFIGPLSQNSHANCIVGNVSAPIDFDGHILAAEIKVNGSVVGGNSTASGNVLVIPGTVSPPNAQGVYSAKIQVADPNNPGQFIAKSNNGGISTLFPDSWTANRIKVEVDAAYQNRTIVGNKWSGMTPSGVRVEGYIKPKTTVFPKL
ncbi:Ribonuclease [compost metagenome]